MPARKAPAKKAGQKLAPTVAPLRPANKPQVIPPVKRVTPSASPKPAHPAKGGR